MSKIYECDGCGIQFYDKNKLTIINLPMIQIQNSYIDYDFCDKCLGKVHQLVRNFLSTKKNHDTK